MSSIDLTVLIITAFAQWTATAGMLWLTWWAAQSRDPQALRIVAMVLVVVPALLWPLLSMSITMGGTESITSRAVLIGAMGAVVAVVRAFFLVVWAIVSKDRQYLRVGGGVIAFLQLAGLGVQLLGGLLRA